MIQSVTSGLRPQPQTFHTASQPAVRFGHEDHEHEDEFKPVQAPKLSPEEQKRQNAEFRKQILQALNISGILTGIVVAMALAGYLLSGPKSKQPDPAPQPVQSEPLKRG